MTDWLYIKDKDGYFRTYIKNELVKENTFIDKKPEETALPLYNEIKELLPCPVWEDNQDAIKCYWETWKIAFGNLRAINIESGFVSNYISPAFNGNLFMWDSVFMLMFGLYGNRVFNFQKTLDNFYARQHPDGFICRELNEVTGDEQFHRYDPSSTGPNLLAWSEWSYYNLYYDKERLGSVFPVISAYHRWMRNFRTWLDGSYYSTGWGCGMDNQPRIIQDYQIEFFHGHMSWIDVTLQHLLSARIICKIAEELGRSSEVFEFEKEVDQLYKLVNDKMWDNEKAFYFDRFSDGSLSSVMTIGSFWALLSEAVPSTKLDQFIANLNDPSTFKRPHMVPTLAANVPEYEPKGNYWRGSIWAPTNYMVLKGLHCNGYLDLAHEIGLNHYTNVLKVFNDTGTLWENYAPDEIVKGSLAAPQFVGWTGISTINVLFEFVFGVNSNVSENTITWEIRLLSRHGIMCYPFGKDGNVDLICEKRNSINEKPIIKAKSNIPITLKVKCNNHVRLYKVDSTGSKLLDSM